MADDTATTEEPYDIAVRLQNKYETIKSLSFHFSQNTEAELGGRPQTGSGEAFFLRDPNNPKMRWNYFTPDQQVLISDSAFFSMYFANLQQMIITRASEMESHLTYAFFTGSGSIIDDFLIFSPDEEVGADSASGAFKVIKIIPKEVQSQVKDIHLWVTNESLIQRIEIRDHFDTRTTLNLSKIKLNVLDPLNADELDNLFTFIPPEDTEIIRQ